MMKNFLSLAVICVLLSSCVSPLTKPIPDEYVGPTAIVSDSMKRISDTKVIFFYLDKISKRRIETSADKTYQRNHGRGIWLDPIVIDRKIPAQESDFVIGGHTYHAMPILSLFGRNLEISGKVHFRPEPEKKYIVKGVLGTEYSAVWIEDAEGNFVTKKIEKYSK